MITQNYDPSDFSFIPLLMGLGTCRIENHKTMHAKMQLFDIKNARKHAYKNLCALKNAIQKYFLTSKV